MTLEEFEAGRQELRCALCGFTGGLCQAPPNPQNGGIAVNCRRCGRQHALGRTLYLKQNNKKRRKPAPMGKGLYEVWEAYGSRCVFCTLPQSFFVFMRIGIHAHHVEPYAGSEHDGPVIPLCAPCHEIATARQREGWKTFKRIQEIHGEPVPPGRSGVSEPRLSPDSMRTARQTPVGAVEGFSDHYADD